MRNALVKMISISLIISFLFLPVNWITYQSTASFLNLNHNQEYTLLIIAPSEFSTTLQPLITHKNSMGLSTKLVTLEDVYNQMFWQGRDNPEKIKYFIKKAVEIWQTEFVLLVGNFQKMPIRYVHNQDVLQGFSSCLEST